MILISLLVLPFVAALLSFMLPKQAKTLALLSSAIAVLITLYLSMHVAEGGLDVS
jgi:hypothetical protein